MKKSILTFALFSLVVLTSFTTLNSPAETGDDDDTGTPTTTTNRTDSGGTGNSQDIGGNKKQDNITTVLPITNQYPNQDIPSRSKFDF